MATAENSLYTAYKFPRLPVSKSVLSVLYVQFIERDVSFSFVVDSARCVGWPSMERASARFRYEHGAGFDESADAAKAKSEMAMKSIVASIISATLVRETLITESLIRFESCITII